MKLISISVIALFVAQNVIGPRVAHADDGAHFDTETLAQIQQIATYLFKSKKSEEKPANKACAFRSKPPKDPLKLVIQRISKDSLEGTLHLGSEDPVHVTFEHSGNENDIHVYSWWKGFYGTFLIRAYVAVIGENEQSITIEIKDGWFSEKMRVSSVCHLEGVELGTDEYADEG